MMEPGDNVCPHPGLNHIETAPLKDLLRIKAEPIKHLHARRRPAVSTSRREGRQGNMPDERTRPLSLRRSFEGSALVAIFAWRCQGECLISGRRRIAVTSRTHPQTPTLRRS